MRTFIALVPSEQSIKDLTNLQKKIRYLARDAKTPIEKFHLTLIFCGDIDTGHVQNLAHLLMTTELVSHFSLPPKHLAFLGHDHTKRLVFEFEKTPLIDAMFMITAHEMSRVKIPLDTTRPFLPHISLAKIKSRLKIPTGLDLPQIEFSELVLFKSILKRLGSEFHPIVRIKLR